jgi:hypothetical protein
VWAPYGSAEIRTRIGQQLAHGPYASSPLYGTGNAGQQIAEVLRDVASDRAHSRKVG